MKLDTWIGIQMYMRIGFFMNIELEEKGIIFHEQLIIVLLPLFILCELLAHIFDKL
jgi:hypothetical protein